MELLIYLLKVSACTVLFFAFYLLVLRHLTFFKINRFYLLLTLLLSFVIPTLNFTIEREVEATPIVNPPIEIADENFVNEPITAIAPIEKMPIVIESFDYYSLLPYLYFGIVLSLLLIATWRILQLLKHTKNAAERINGLKIVQKSAGFTNCSFFNYVFIDDKLSEAELQVLLKHEEVHANQFHSIDKIIMMLIKAFLWFNPVVYLYDEALEQAHEYEATSQNFGTEQYANLLLRLAIAKSEMPLVHNFVKSPIKDRIKMLFNSKSKNMKKLMYLLALPIGLGLLWGFTVKVVEVAKTDSFVDKRKIASKNAKLDTKLWGKTLKGKVKSLLLTEMGEVINFKYDKGVIRILNLPKANLSVGDEVLITLSKGTTVDIKFYDAKGNLISFLDGPCYNMDMVKTLEGKVLYDKNNRPFLSKDVVMQYGQYKSEKFTLHTVSGKTPSLRIVHSPISSEPSKIFIYVNGKLYSEKETLKFDKTFIANLSEKRGFAKAMDYDIPGIANKDKTYIFWFGNEPKLTSKVVHLRNFSQKHNSKKVNSKIVGLSNSSLNKTSAGFSAKNEILEKIRPILLRSCSLTVDKKTDITYVKDGVYKIGEKQLDADEIAYDKRNEKLMAKNGKLKLENGSLVSEKYIIYDLQKNSYITNNTPDSKIQVNSGGAEFITNLKAQNNSLNHVNIFGQPRMLTGKVVVKTENYILNAKVLEAEPNSEIIKAHKASVLLNNGSILNGDIIEYDIVSKNYKIINPHGSLYSK